MAKKYIPLYLKNERDEEIILDFRLGPRAISHFQAISKKGLNEIGEDLGIDDMVALIYAGCKDAHRDLTLDLMWDLIDNFELDELTNLTTQIFPQNEEEVEGDYPNEY